MAPSNHELQRWRRRVTLTVVGGVCAVSIALALLVASGSSPWARLGWGFFLALQAYNFGVYLTRRIENRPGDGQDSPTSNEEGVLL